MKKYLLVIAISFVLIQRVCSQTGETQTSNIDKVRQEIKNNINNYQKIENIQTKTGFRSTYKKGKELKLIVVEVKDSIGLGKCLDKKVEWYFSKGYLIYSEQIWTDLEANKIVDHQKLYLDDKHLISWIKNENQSLDINSKEFKETEATLMAYGVTLVENAK
jgi:hypothetical protein